MATDPTKLDALVGQFVADLRATLHAANVVIGARLGLVGGEGSDTQPR